MAFNLRNGFLLQLSVFSSSGRGGGREGEEMAFFFSFLMPLDINAQRAHASSWYACSVAKHVTTAETHWGRER